MTDIEIAILRAIADYDITAEEVRDFAAALIARAAVYTQTPAAEARMQLAENDIDIA